MIYFLLALIICIQFLQAIPNRSNALTKSILGNAGISIQNQGNNNQKGSSVQVQKDPRQIIRRLSRGGLSGTLLYPIDKIKKIALTGKPTDVELREIMQIMVKDGNMDYALGKAASWKDEKIFDQLINNPHIQFSKQGKNIALQMAAAHGNVEFMKRLLKEKDIDAAADENLALFFAIFHNQPEAFNLLIEQKGVKVTPSIYSIAKRPGREWFLTRIFLKYPHFAEGPEKKYFEDPLILAVKRQDFKVINILLNLGGRSDSEISELLNVAVETGNSEIVDLILTKAFNVMVMMINDNEAIRLAAKMGNADLVEKLLPYSTYLDDALFLAATHGKLEVVEFLLGINGVKIPQFTLELSPHHIQQRLKLEPIERFEPKNYVYRLAEDL